MRGKLSHRGEWGPDEVWLRAAGSLRPFVVQPSSRKHNRQEVALDKDLFRQKVRRHQAIRGGLGVRAGAGAEVPTGSGTEAQSWLPATVQPAGTTRGHVAFREELAWAGAAPVRWEPHLLASHCEFACFRAFSRIRS